MAMTNPTPPSARSLGDRRALPDVAGFTRAGSVVSLMALRLAAQQAEPAADYTMAPDARDLLMGAVGLPYALRREALRLIVREGGVGALLDAFANFIGLANSVVENNREMIEVILMCEGGLSDRDARNANLPTIFGALNGLRVAEGVDIEKTCAGCAFRVGTPANQSPSTTCDADWCGHPGEQEFLCHVDGLDPDGNPTQACAGWAQLRVNRKRSEPTP